MPSALRVFCLRFRLKEQDGHADEMTDLICSAPVKQIADKAMAVRRHGDEINVVGADELDDLVRGFPHREHTVDGKALAAQLRGAALEIGSVHFDFLAFREIELVKVSCDPAISDVHEQKARAGHSSQRFDVIQDRLICGAILDGDKDGAIHSSPYPAGSPKKL
jgi:hypothetical protein